MKLKPTMNAFPIRETRKIKFLRMKLTLLFLVCMVGGYSQVKINLNCENRKVSEVFNDIRKQSGFIVIYESSDMNPGMKVSLKLKDAGIHEVMKAILQGTDLTYTISEDYIAISKKDAASDKSEKFVNISGRVTDKDGNPLPGATVLIKGTTKGTTTDANGNYAIKVPEGTVLVFSFVGFHKQEISVSPENTEINVVMQETAMELDEVAVISTGYQKIKPEQSTGSIATMQVKEYDTRINTTDFLTGLVNKIPGLLINNDIEFEGNSLFHIRGISTILGERDPLIVIDGYPTELTLDMINPNEIESVTVLKDAAAATVYGVRASNGVIVIERKKAKEGDLRVNFRTTASFTPKENYDRYRWDKDGSNILINYRRDHNPYPSYYWSFLTNPSLAMLFSMDDLGMLIAQEAAGAIPAEEAEAQYAALGSYYNADDYSRLFERTAVTQTYNLDVSGGNEKLLYYLTANYSHGKTNQIMNNNNSLKLSGRATMKFSDRFSLRLTTDFQKSKKNSAPVPNISSIYPYERFEDEDGTPLYLSSMSSGATSYYNDYLMSIGLYDNMYYPLVDINEISTKTTTLLNRITADFLYDLGKGFNVTFGGVYENSRTDSRYLASENSSVVHQYVNYYAESAGSGAYTYNVPMGDFLKESKSSSENYALRAQLNYDKQINNDHSLNLIFGGEIKETISTSNTASYFGYDDVNLFTQSVDLTLFETGLYSSSILPYGSSLSYSSLFNQGYVKNHYISIYSNAVYAYKGKYSFTGSFRIDQTNLFGTNPKYKYKPLWSVGAAWNIHKEKFMQDVAWVKSLKLKMAYGFTGNVAKNVLPEVIASDSYFYYGSKASVSDISPRVDNLTLYSYANSGLRWEQVATYNVGLDFTVFKNINGSIEYYTKKTTDALATMEMDNTKGGSTAKQNQASLRNSGLEITLHADWITRKSFNWNTGLVFSHNSSKVLEVYNDTDPRFYASSYSFGRTSYLPGYSISALFAYRYAGLDDTGEVLIYDKDGNIKKLGEDNQGLDDIDYAGSTLPTYTIGLSNRVDIGNFYMYCMLNFCGGFKVKVPVSSANPLLGARPLEGATNYWMQAGDEADPDVLPSDVEQLSYLMYTDKQTVNGAYLTLGDITAAYSFRNSKWLKKNGISNLEVRAQAHNVYTVAFNKYNYSMAAGTYAKSYVTPTYSFALHINF